MHSLHLPFLRHEVGTRTPTRSAQSKIESISLETTADCPLMESATDIRDDPLPLPEAPGRGRKNHHFVLASSSALTASATARAEPERSCSSLHFHCAT